MYIEERIIELPHTGETLLAIIRTQDRVSQSMDHLEHTSRTIEEFMGEPTRQITSPCSITTILLSTMRAAEILT